MVERDSTLTGRKADLWSECYFLNEFHIVKSGDVFPKNKFFVDYG